MQKRVRQSLLETSFHDSKLIHALSKTLAKDKRSSLFVQKLSEKET